MVVLRQLLCQHMEASEKEVTNSTIVDDIMN